MRYQKTELSNKKHIPDKKYKIDERYIPPRQVKILTAQRKRRKRRLIRRFLMIGCGLVLAGTLAVGLLKSDIRRYWSLLFRIRQEIRMRFLTAALLGKILIRAVKVQVI